MPERQYIVHWAEHLPLKVTVVVSSVKILVFILPVHRRECIVTQVTAPSSDTPTCLLKKQGWGLDFFFSRISRNKLQPYLFFEMLKGCLLKPTFTMCYKRPAFPSTTDVVWGYRESPRMFNGIHGVFILEVKLWTTVRVLQAFLESAFDAHSCPTIYERENRLMSG